MTNYERLLRERIQVRHDDLRRLNLNFFKTLSTCEMQIETLEQLCVELACQMFAFSSRRASHLPILSAFKDREECEREERAVLARIKAGCEEDVK